MISWYIRQTDFGNKVTSKLGQKIFLSFSKIQTVFPSSSSPLSPPPDRRPPLRGVQREDRQVRRLGRRHVHHRPERAVHHRLRVRLLRHLRARGREGGGPLRGGGVRLAEV